MNSKKTLAAPLLMITVGSGWLMTVLGVIPSIDWIWTLGIASVGILAFVIGGFDKVTLVTGGFALITSLLSVVRQTGRISLDVEVPILVITAGILILIARNQWIPDPTWVKKLQTGE